MVKYLHLREIYCAKTYNQFDTIQLTTAERKCSQHRCRILKFDGCVHLVSRGVCPKRDTRFWRSRRRPNLNSTDRSTATEQFLEVEVGDAPIEIAHENIRLVCLLAMNVDFDLFSLGGHPHALLLLDIHSRGRLCFAFAFGLSAGSQLVLRGGASGLGAIVIIAIKRHASETLRDIVWIKILGGRRWTAKASHFLFVVAGNDQRY